MKITQIQVFNHDGQDFSANIAIDDKFMIQLGTDGEFSIPSSNEAVWSSDGEQDFAKENYDAGEIVSLLEIPNTEKELREMGAI